MTFSNTTKIRIHRKLNRSVSGNLGMFIFVLIFGVFMAFPLVYAIGNSLKPLDELWMFPPRLFPQNPTGRNFSELIALLQNSWIPFLRYLFNTLLITITGTAGQIIFASMCAYPLAKYNLPGFKIIFNIVIISLMFSTSVTAIPNYLTMVKLGWVDKYSSIIVPAFGSSLGLFLMKQFMEQIHMSLIEAAKIDGAGEMRIFWRIIMPNCKSAWLTLIIFSVSSLWNLNSTIFIYDEKLKTLPYAISQIAAGGIARAGVGAAGSVFLLIIPVCIFVITQSNIIETMSSSGIKE